MTSIIVPSRLLPNRQRDPLVKPTGNVEIDWSHPLAKTMTLCVVPDKQGAARNSVDGVVFPRNSNQSMVGSSTGYASYTSSDKHYLKSTGYTPLNVGTGDFSMMIVVAVSSSAGSCIVYHQRDNSGTFSSAFFRLNSYYTQNATSSTASAGAVYFGGFESGTSKNARGAYITSGGLTGRQQVFVGTRKSGVWSLYGDGVLLATYNGSSNVIDVSTGIDEISIGGWTTLTTLGVIGNIYAVAGWTRALSAVEAVSLTADPYQFLREVF